MGAVLVPDERQQGELVAFSPSSAEIEFEAQSDAEFVQARLSRMITTSTHLVDPWPKLAV
jgi:hypothetical protein